MTLVVGAAEGPMAFGNAYADTNSVPSCTAEMTRMRHTMLVDGATQVTLWFAHWAQYETRFSTGAAPTQPLAVKAAVEVVGAGTPSATRGAITAAQTVTLQPGDTKSLTFTLPTAVAKGAYFYSATYVTAPLDPSTSQPQIPSGSSLSVARAEGWEINGTDKTTAGTVTAPASGGQACYGPVRIDATTSGSPVASVALVGDSIAAPRDGFLQQALAAQPHVGVAVPGDAAYQFTRSAEHVHRLALIDACDIALCQYGANDATPGGQTLSAWVGNAVAVWQLLGKSSTRPVWQTTTTPHTSSSDGFTTTAGQTLTAAVSALIVSWNDWLRAGAPLVGGAYAAVGTAGALTCGQAGHPLRGVLEVADAAETARDSGLWRSTGGAWTADGLHPTDLGKASIAAGISIAPLLAVASGVLSVRIGGVTHAVLGVRQGGVTYPITGARRGGVTYPA